MNDKLNNNKKGKIIRLDQIKIEREKFYDIIIIMIIFNIERLFIIRLNVKSYRILYLYKLRVNRTKRNEMKSLV